MAACAIATAVLVSALPGAASAATFVTYQDRTAFRAASGPLQTETFEGFKSDIALSNAYDAGRFSLSGKRSDGGASGAKIDVTPFQNGANGVNGTNHLFVPVSSFSSYSESLVFTFAEGITEFGANFISGSGGLIELLVDGQLVNGSATTGGFFGFKSDTAFRSVELRARPGSGYHYYVDNLTFSAAAVPEPATWAMLIGGFALTGGAMRRRLPVRRAIGLA